MNSAKPRKAIALGGRTLRTVRTTRRSTKPRKGTFAEVGKRPTGTGRPSIASGVRNPTYLVPPLDAGGHVIRNVSPPKSTRRRG